MVYDMHVYFLSVLSITSIHLPKSYLCYTKKFQMNIISKFKKVCFSEFEKWK